MIPMPPHDTDDARTLGINHEEAGQRGGNSAIDKAMDLFNNYVGICIGSANDPNNKFSCQDGCFNKLIQGGLKEGVWNSGSSNFDLLPTDFNLWEQ